MEEVHKEKDHNLSNNIHQNIVRDSLNLKNNARPQQHTLGNLLKTMNKGGVENVEINMEPRVAARLRSRDKLSPSRQTQTPAQPKRELSPQLNKADHLNSKGIYLPHASLYHKAQEQANNSTQGFYNMNYHYQQSVQLTNTSFIPKRELSPPMNKRPNSIDLKSRRFEKMVIQPPSPRYEPAKEIIVTLPSAPDVDADAVEAVLDHGNITIVEDSPEIEVDTLPPKGILRPQFEFKKNREASPGRKVANINKEVDDIAAQIALTQIAQASTKIVHDPKIKALEKKAVMHQKLATDKSYFFGPIKNFDPNSKKTNPYTDHLAIGFRIFQTFKDKIKRSLQNARPNKQVYFPGSYVPGRLTILFDLDETFVHCDIRNLTKHHDEQVRIQIRDAFGRRMMVAPN